MRLIIEGRVRQPWEFAFDELVQMPSRTLTMTLECAGNSRIFLSPKAGGLQWELGAVGNAEWTGVLLAAVLKRAGVKAGAVEVVLEGADSGAIAKESVSPGKIHYARSLPLAKALMPEDVQAAVRAARSHGLPLSVRGGGHDWAGRVLRHDGLVIDLSVMRKVTVDAAAKVATVAGGATAADVTAAISEHGLAAVTGNVGAVGIAGLFLEGGYGPLTTRFGLLWTTCSALRLFSPMAGSLLPMRRKTPICSGHFGAEAAILAWSRRCVFAFIR